MATVLPTADEEFSQCSTTGTGAFNVHHAAVIHDRTPVRCSSKSKRAGVGNEPKDPWVLQHELSLHMIRAAVRYNIRPPIRPVRTALSKFSYFRLQMNEEKGNIGDLHREESAAMSDAPKHL